MNYYIDSDNTPKILKKYERISDGNLNDLNVVLTYYEKLNDVNINKWRDSFRIVLDDWIDVQDSNKSQNTQIQALEKLLHMLADEILIKIRDLKRNNLLDCYGPIEYLKSKLRDSINVLEFKDLLDLYRCYQKTEEDLLKEEEFLYLDAFNKDENPFTDYIKAYHLGKALISDKMNQLNYNKAKHKYISPELLDEALMFYYNTTSAQAAYSIRSTDKYTQNKSIGDKGEQKVLYALKWLDKSYINLERRSHDQVGNSCILISNPEYMDVTQEYDHLIVSTKGVFNIETKNYTGKLFIDSAGNWTREKNGETEGIKNPLQQIRQHEKVLRSFLPEDCPIISIICIANDKSILKGTENSPVPIVKSDMLVEFIETLKTTHSILDTDKEMCVQSIYNHML